MLVTGLTKPSRSERNRIVGPSSTELWLVADGAATSSAHPISAGNGNRNSGNRSEDFMRAV
jgi:hypothetical protein